MNKMIIAGGMLVLSVALMSQTQKPAQAKKPAAASSKVPNAATMDRGKQVYLEQCLACHQADALGVQGMNPPLVKTKWVLGDKTTLVQVVLKGMTGEVDINGDTYHNVMAPHPDLTDQQIADVLTYVRNSFGNKASAVTAAEVKAIRAKTK
ncbi:MAG TPA: cytochrome c [Puia sp.]|jgi:mono/diheme cytochrome c family protein|nr:cytochrome c [Puia sp.]